MVVLKNIKVSSSKNLSSELLVLGRFKNSNIEKLITYLSSEDKKNVINFHKSGRKKPKSYEHDSLMRQYGKKV